MSVHKFDVSRMQVQERHQRLCFIIRHVFNISYVRTIEIQDFFPGFWMHWH